MRITSKGQVTIPIEIREKLGLLPDSEVEFELVGNAVRLRKARRPRKPSRGRSLVARLRGKGSVRMTTDEILAHTRGGR
jgi:AbrB family looped-hinge helix DNA binding protein